MNRPPLSSGPHHAGTSRPSSAAMDWSPATPRRNPVAGILRPPSSTMKCSPEDPEKEQKSQRVPDFILYVHSRCSQSNGLVNLLIQRPLSQILVQDVSAIAQKPPWLNGVPTLVDTKIGLVYKGSDAITFVRNLIELQINNDRRQRPPQRESRYDETDHRPQKQEAAQGDVAQETHDKFELFQNTAAPGSSPISLPSNSHRYEGDSASTPVSIADYQKRRDSQISRIKPN